MALDEVRINNLQISKASAILKLDDEEVNGWVSIKYADAIESAYAYGAGRHQGPRGRTAGKYTPEEITIVVAKSTTKALLARLAAKSVSGRSAGSVTFNGSLQYVEPGDATITDGFEGLRLTKISTSVDDSSDATNDELGFSVMRIKRDGIVLYDDRQGAGV
jgi:hypothetical protein